MVPSEGGAKAERKRSKSGGRKGACRKIGKKDFGVGQRAHLKRYTRGGVVDREGRDDQTGTTWNCNEITRKEKGAFCEKGGGELGNEAPEEKSSKRGKDKI